MKNLEQFDVMTSAELSTVEGGVSCFEGVIGVGGLGSTAGPWGLVGGVLVGAAAFCMK